MFISKFDNNASLLRHDKYIVALLLSKYSARAHFRVERPSADERRRRIHEAGCETFPARPATCDNEHTAMIKPTFKITISITVF